MENNLCKCGKSAIIHVEETDYNSEIDLCEKCHGEFMADIIGGCYFY